MPDPPKPAQPAPESSRGAPRSERERAALAELIEVERALASLEGRNVDNAEHLVRMRRDAERRKAALEQILASSRDEMARRRRRLPVKIAAVLVALGVVAAVGWHASLSVRTELDGRDKVGAEAAAVARPFEDRFTASRTVTGADPVTVTAPKGQCFVVAASGTGGPAQVKAERDGVAREAASTIGWCSCKDEEVTLTLRGPAPVAAVILTAPADTIGGADALAAMPPRPAAVFREAVDRACAEAAFDAWTLTHKPEPLALESEKLPAAEQALVREGLAIVEIVPAGTPFVVPPAAADHCMITVPRDAGTLALRQKGGERPLAAKKGALGFCAKDPSTVSVWHDGDAEVTLLQVPRARIGGLLGLREAASRAGVPLTVWTPPDELAEDARATLAASGVGPTFVEGRPQVYTLSSEARAMLAESLLGPDVLCRPPLEVGAVQSVCLESRAAAFPPPSGPFPPALASAPEPLWLALPDRPDRPSLDRALDLLAFARRMTAAGYELTSLVGAKITPRGADITGRSGEKEIVALLVSPTPPYLHTLSATTPWPLSSPVPTPLPPGTTAKLTATPKLTAPAKREFIIWRR